MVFGLSSPACKNISLNPSGKSPLQTRPSHPKEGRVAIVTNARWDAVDARASGAHRAIAGQADKAFERSTGAQTNDANAYGEVVWSWHPLLMSSLRRCVGPTGLRQISIRRRR